MIKKIIQTVLIFLLLAITLLTVMSLTGIPKGFRPFVVLSGSMEPTIDTGSVIFIKPQTEYFKGDIITFKYPDISDIRNKDNIITHRIYEIVSTKNSMLFVTKGDANNAPDINKIDKDLVLGKVLFSIPLLGYLINFVKTQQGFIFVIVIPATLIIYSELLNIFKEVKLLVSKRYKNYEI